MPQRLEFEQVERGREPTVGIADMQSSSWVVSVAECHLPEAGAADPHGRANGMRMRMGTAPSVNALE